MAAHDLKYQEDFPRQAAHLCKYGATDQDLGDFFGVKDRQIRRWRSKYPEFDKACTIGKGQADNIVERRLYERAIGYSHPEDKFFVVNGEIKRVQTTKHYPPDTGAAIFWVKARMGYRENKPLDDPLDLEALPREEKLRRVKFMLEQIKREEEKVISETKQINGKS